MYNTSTFTMRPTLVLSPQNSQNTSDNEQDIGKDGKNEALIESKDKTVHNNDIMEANTKEVKDENENHDIIEANYKKEKDENENQKGRNNFTEQEKIFLEQLSKVVLGTYSSK